MIQFFAIFYILFLYALCISFRSKEVRIFEYLNIKYCFVGYFNNKVLFLLLSLFSFSLSSISSTNRDNFVT